MRYDDLTAWREYQTFFPERLRLQQPPVEERWRWGRFDVHLDRYGVAAPRGKVIVFHGLAGNGRLFSPFGVVLQRAGYEVVIPDLPPFGLTAGPLDGLEFADWVELGRDLVARESTAGPVIVFGGSIGGMLAYDVAAASPHVAGVVATNLTDPRRKDVQACFTKNAFLRHVGTPVAFALPWLFDSLTLPVVSVGDVDAVANDPRFTQQLARDPHAAGARLPLKLVRTMTLFAPAVEPERFVRPVLLVHPAADRWTPVSLSQPFFDRLAGPKQLVLLENAGHVPLEEPGLTQLEHAVLTFLETTLTSASPVPAPRMP